MHDGTYRTLRSLIEKGSIPSSALSGRTAQRLQPLLDSGALIRRRCGRGMILEVADRNALDAFLRRLFPHGATAPMQSDGSTFPPRGEAVALYRNAKRARAASAEPVLLRAIAPAVASRDSSKLDLLALTRTAGAACLLIDDGERWRIESRIAIVENLEVFLHFERLQTGRSIALYANGRLSGRVLDWLASREMSRCEFLHCGDYDPVGLDEYVRLRDRLGSRVVLHVPANLDGLLARYGKRGLIEDSAAILARLRRSPVPEVRRIAGIMDTTGCGLEQEALLLGQQPT